MIASTTVLTSDDIYEPPKPLKAPSIVCGDVELFVCDDVELASECPYAAGDPINLRDPWGLHSEGDAAAVMARDCKVIPHVGVGNCGGSAPATPNSSGPDVQEEADKTDELGCVVGAAGDGCRRTRRVQAANEARASTNAERAQATPTWYERLNSAGSVAPAPPGPPKPPGTLTRLRNSVESWFEDDEAVQLSEYGVNTGFGLSNTPMDPASRGNIPTIGKAARHAPLLLVAAIAGPLGRLGLDAVGAAAFGAGEAGFYSFEVAGGSMGGFIRANGQTLEVVVNTIHAPGAGAEVTQGAFTGVQIAC